MPASGSIVQLYRAILKIHQHKLPAPMREMGDKYVKEEFQAHIRGKASEEQMHQFVTEWTRYKEMLSGQDDTDPQPDVLTQMNADQQQRMSGLYSEAKKLRKQMIDEALPLYGSRGD